ncbi:MAG: glycosyltransferase family 4 protein [Fervidicoccaceae archaeon]
MTNPTIIILCNSFPPSISGVGRYVYNIVKHLRYKYNFVVITMRSKNELYVKTYTVANGDKLISRNIVYFVPQASWNLPYFSTLPILVRSLLLKTHSNIIHTQSIGQVHSDLASLLSFKKSIIYTIHGWRNATSLIAQRMYITYESIVPFFLKGADIITVLGNKSKEYICSLLKDPILCKERVIITPNGVDFYAVRRIIESVRSRNIEKEGKNVLFVGRLVRTKGLIELLLAFKMLTKIDREIKLLIVGNGPLSSFVMSFISRHDLRNRVEFAEGVLPWEKVILEYYSRADVFVLPSYSEGLPTVLLEAMATGVPVVTTPVGDITDIVRHGETGILVKPGNIKMLAEAILTILQDKSLRKEIVSNALNTVRNYDWKVIANIFDNVYNRMIE